MVKICVFQPIRQKLAIFRKKYITRKQNALGHIFHFLSPQIQQLFNYGMDRVFAILDQKDSK